MRLFFWKLAIDVVQTFLSALRQTRMSVVQLKSWKELMRVGTNWGAYSYED